MEFGSAKMPLSNQSSGITEPFQSFGEGGFFQRQMLLPVRQAEAAVRGGGFARNPVGDVQSRGGFAGHDGRACWRAHGARSVGLREAHSGGGQPIKVWRPIKLAAEASAIRPTHIVDEDEHNVRFDRWRGIGADSRNHRSKRHQNVAQEDNSQTGCPTSVSLHCGGI